MDDRSILLSHHLPTPYFVLIDVKSAIDTDWYSPLHGMDVEVSYYLFSFSPSSSFTGGGNLKVVSTKLAPSIISLCHEKPQTAPPHMTLRPNDDTTLKIPPWRIEAEA